MRVQAELEGLSNMHTQLQAECVQLRHNVDSAQLAMPSKELQVALVTCDDHKTIRNPFVVHVFVLLTLVVSNRF